MILAVLKEDKFNDSRDTQFENIDLNVVTLLMSKLPKLIDFI